MIVGTGIDIIVIERVKRLLTRHPQRFPQRILTAAELIRFSTSAHPERYLAKRFAAKEAALKALGTGLRNLTWQELETTQDTMGKPLLTLSGAAKTLAQTLGVVRLHLSISDEKEYAIASVILEG